MDPLFEIDFKRTVEDSIAPSETLYVELKAAILAGRLMAATLLPSTRRSGAYFGVSRNTLANVYDRLGSDGLVLTRRGSGTYVAQPFPARNSRPSSTRQEQPDGRLNKFWLRPDVSAAMNFWRDTADPVPAPQKAGPIDFRPALVDSRLFPHQHWRRITAKEMRVLERKPARYKSPQGNQGNYYLRNAIVRHIALTRAVVCSPEDILVTCGAQQAFDILARTLVIPGKTAVAMEDPGYPPMRVAFAAAGARLVPVGVDREGMIVDQIPSDVSVICVCPSHQFPLGMTMSEPRRKALVEFARRQGAVVIEDDYDGEFRLDGSPLQALRTADTADVVFYVGTFSKCMLPVLRLGFVIAPEWAMQTLILAKNCMDWHCSTPVQLGVAGFIAEGHLAHHVRKMRGVYQTRRDLVMSFIKDELVDWLDPIPSFYGMHVATTARKMMDLDQVADALLKSHVKIHTLRRYYAGPQAREGLIFGYGTPDLSDSKRGLAMLRQILRQQTRRKAG